MRFSVSELWRGLTLACALLLLIPLASCTDEANAATLDDLNVEMFADSMRVTVGHTVDPRADSATVRVTIGTASQTRRAASLTGSTAFTFPAPAEGATVTITAQVCAYRAPLAPQCVGRNRSWTRPVGPLDPPVIDTIDVGEVAAAIGRAPVLDSVQIVRVSGETCEIERRDYYGHELLIVLDSSAEAAGCEVELQRHIYNSGSLYQSVLSTNARVIHRADSIYASLWPRLQVRWDSVMDGLLPAENRWCSLCERDAPVAAWPEILDTLVAQPRGSEPPLLAIADYRSAHPGWTWP